MDWEVIFAWIGRAVTVVAPLGLAALWLGRTYMDKWLTNRFQGQLDALKHAQALEMAKLKLMFDAKLHRATKLHEREFEILPKAWDLMGEAGGTIRLMIDKDQKHTDVGKLRPLELSEFLANLPLSPAEKQAIIDAPTAERTNLYIERKLRLQMVEAATKAQEFHNFVAGKGIFIEPSLRKKLMRISEVFESVVNTHSMLVVHGSPPKVDVGALNRQKLESTGKLVEEIGDDISERIWGASKVDEA